jgi:hypothetical protein
MTVNAAQKKSHLLPNSIDELLNHRSFALDDHLDSPVAQISHKTSDVKVSGGVARLVAEPYTLNVPGKKDGLSLEFLLRRHLHSPSQAFKSPPNLRQVEV